MQNTIEIEIRREHVQSNWMAVLAMGLAALAAVGSLLTDQPPLLPLILAALGLAHARYSK
jgi:hypothetical protein